MPPEELPPEDESAGPLADIGRYRRLKAARERGLVIAAMGLPHWIEREGGAWVLRVEESAHGQAAAAVAEFESEERSRPRAPVLEPLKIPKLAVLMTLVAMAVFHRLQMIAPQPLIARGVAADDAIRAGEWWRIFTALTLHGDVEHLVSNMSLAVFVSARSWAGLWGICSMRSRTWRRRITALDRPRRFLRASACSPGASLHRG
jgi:Rhomboid family